VRRRGTGIGSMDAGASEQAELLAELLTVDPALAAALRDAQSQQTLGEAEREAILQRTRSALVTLSLQYASGEVGHWGHELVVASPVKRADGIACASGPASDIVPQLQAWQSYHSRLQEVLTELQERQDHRR